MTRLLPLIVGLLATLLMACTLPLPPGTTTQIPPTPIAGGDFAALQLPPDTTVNRTGCASDGYCDARGVNFYWAPTHEVVLVNERQSIHAETHEHLHAHQHWTINGGAPLPPSGYDLHAWYTSEQGKSFMAEVGIPDILWSSNSCRSAQNGIESFACVGQLWYNNPAKLHELCPVCYDWTVSSLP